VAKMILLTLPRSGSHLTAGILKCNPAFTLKAYYKWIPEEDVVKKIKTEKDIWFHYPYVESVRKALQESQQDKYLLLRDPRAIIVSWAYYCEEPNSALDIYYDSKYLHEYPLKKRIDILIDEVRDLIYDYEKWRQSGMFIVLRYRDILFNPLARTALTGFRLGVLGGYDDDMTYQQVKKCNSLYKNEIESW